MIEVVKNIWIGNSDAEKWIGRHQPPMNAVLVVANDLSPTNDWRHGIEYMHVGLVDGPGNSLAAYHAVVLALVALVKRGNGRRILVCDHDGGRSLAVVMMYLYLMGDGPSWDECLERLNGKGLPAPRSDMPKVHSIHRDAFFLMDWGMMTRVLSGEVSDDRDSKQ